MTHSSPLRLPLPLILAGLLLTVGAHGDPPAPDAATAGMTSLCEETPETLCLGEDGRFRVSAHWEDFQGGTGVGHAIPLFGDSGSFWFFRPDNVELTAKVIDGREVNGHFWVFFGSLSNVAFTLRVTDTETGVSIPYTNPSGRFASTGDTRAFPAGAEFCGGFAGFPCGPDEVCDLEPGSCNVADAGGVCRVRPEVCVQVFDPVCGCDGVTYPNDCERLAAGVTRAFFGPCEDDRSDGAE